LSVGADTIIQTIFIFLLSLPCQFSQDIGKWPENQILIPDLTYFCCPGATLLYIFQLIEVFSFDKVRISIHASCVLSKAYAAVLVVAEHWHGVPQMGVLRGWWFLAFIVGSLCLQTVIVLIKQVTLPHVLLNHLLHTSTYSSGSIGLISMAWNGALWCFFFNTPSLWWFAA